MGHINVHCTKLTLPSWSVTIGAPRKFFCGRGWSWGNKQYIFGFKNYVLKIMSNSPSPHLVSLQGQLELIVQEKCWHIWKFHYIFQYSILLLIKPISVTDLGWSIYHVKPLLSLCLQNLCFLNFALVEGGCSPAASPPPHVFFSPFPLFRNSCR